MLLTHTWSHISPLLFEAFWGIFWRIWWSHQKVLRAMTSNLPVLETFIPLWHWLKFEVNCTSNAPSGSGYICEGTKTPLLETGLRLPFWQQWTNIHFSFYSLVHRFYFVVIVLVFVFAFFWRKNCFLLFYLFFTFTIFLIGRGNHS